MTDPVTNALAVQLEYGEDELKEQINEHIRKIAYAVVMEQLYNNDFFNRLVSNNSRLFNDQVQRALKEFINNPRHIY